MTQATLQIPFEVTNVSPTDIADAPGFTDEAWDGDAAIASMPNPSEESDAPDILDRAMTLVPADTGARDNKSNWKAPFRTGPGSRRTFEGLKPIEFDLETLELMFQTHLRGVEATVMPPEVVTFRGCSRRTFEGLKLLTKSRLSTSTGSRRTFEGLKRVGLASLDGVELSSRRTFEGLKL